VVRPKDIKSHLIALATEWVDAALISDLSTFISNLLVERDTSDRSRANALIPPEVIGQFRVFAGQIQFTK